MRLWAVISLASGLGACPPADAVASPALPAVRATRKQKVVQLAVPTTAAAQKRYRWKRRRSGYESLAARFASPAGFSRVKVAPSSYAAWLRHLPLLPVGSPVRSYRGRVIRAGSHRAIAAVIDLDVGRRDRQQCVDTIIRLRGEYLYWRGKADKARFAWAGGRRFGYVQWRRGLRPIKQGRRWQFRKRRRAGHSYRSFRAYLGYMFSWTGTIHQLRERHVAERDLRAGDFFIQPGSPGHAVVLLDVAADARGRRVALIAQGYMPAQDLQVLRGSRAGWFPLEPPKAVLTPLWPRAFTWRQLRRFRD